MRDNLLTCSADRSIRRWNLASGDLLCVSGPGICCSMRAENVKEYILLFADKAHTDEVMCCQMDEDKIVSGSLDHTM